MATGLVAPSMCSKLKLGFCVCCLYLVAMDEFVLRIFTLSFVLIATNAYSLAPAYYGIDRPSLEYELPPLDFGFSQLEPFVDEETVRIHYLGHHAKYTEKMNVALKDWRRKDKTVSRISIVDILRNLSAVPHSWKESLRNNGGGFVNHNLYWSVLSPNLERNERVASGRVADDIVAKWGTFDAFRNAFSEEANSLFGSGYVWLCRNYTEDKKSSELLTVKTLNQDSPLSLGQRLFPVLVIDVWEHAYYLKHRNLRPRYVDSWWGIVDWDAVNRLDDWWQETRFHDEL